MNAFNFNTPILQHSSKPKIIILPPHEEESDHTPGFNKLARLLYKKLFPASKSIDLAYRAYAEED